MIVQDWQFWLLLLLYLSILATIFIGRNWIRTRIEQSVRSGFEAKLETLRSDLRRSEEELKSELRSKETQIAALRDGSLSGRIQRQALADKRRLEAIDGLWTSFITLTSLAMVAKMMASINFDAAVREAHQNANARQFFRSISDGDQTENLLKTAQNSGKSQQPFVSPLAWAYFSAYNTFINGAMLRAKVFESGLKDAHELIPDELVNGVLKTALPHYSQLIDEQPAVAYNFVLDDLEKRLVAEIQKMIRGEEEDQAGVEQAARIMDMVQKASVQQEKQETAATV